MIFTGTHDARDIYNLVLNSNKKKMNEIFYFKFHPRIKFKFNQSNSLRIIEKIDNQKFSKILISQTSTLVYNFIKFNKKFNTISLDFRPSLTSSKLKKKYEIIL